MNERVVHPRPTLDRMKDEVNKELLFAIRELTRRAILMTRPTLNCGLVLAALLLAACNDYGREAPRKFQNGDVVRFIVSGQKAQIIVSHSCTVWRVKNGRSCTYDVRLFSPAIYTDTHLLSSDSPVKFQTISRLDSVREFELEKADR